MYEIHFLQIEEKKEYEEIIRKVMKKCFEIEGLEKTKLYTNVILTNGKEIQKINQTHRNIDQPTDVLSFPMFEASEIEELKQKEEWKVEEVLGDIVIALDVVEKQALEYGHSFQRELSYMTVHGFYHLMGYDHIMIEDKVLMRTKEEIVLEKIEMKRG